MAVPIRMPDFGTTVDEVRVVAWLLKEGEPVKRGQLIAEIETDKAAGELESAAEGVLLKKVVPAGATARTGDVLAYVGRPGESVPDEKPETGDKESTDLPAAPVRVAAGLPRVSPIVRNLAKKLGVDLATVRGTGQGGIITRQDVLHASQKGVAETTAPAGEPLSRSQSAVARAVLKSIREIPHLRIAAEVDMAAAQGIRARSGGTGHKISYDAIFLKAMAEAIQAVPLLAARLDGERVIRPEGIHIALAIGLEDELFLPVIRDVNRKDLLTLQGEITALASGARSGALKAEQMTGGCMALSNLGMYPIESFDAVIFPGHSAILTVGAAQRKPVAVEDHVEIRPVAMVKLAVNHRLINGRTAAEFLATVKDIVESVGLDRD